jgi:uncharacterized membrane protein
MTKERVLAFSDGVIAIIITIMVLELRPPHEPTLEALIPMAPVFLSYTLSFVYLAIYWNNHHHMMAVVERVNGGILWANMALLFFLSLIPFTTAWMGENYEASAPTAIYGVSLILPAFAYVILQTALVREHGKESLLASSLGNDLKGKLSPVAYALGIVLAFVNPHIAQAIYAGVALVWLVPDRRIEKRVTVSL